MPRIQSSMTAREFIDKLELLFELDKERNKEVRELIKRELTDYLLVNSGAHGIYAHKRDQ